MSQTFQVNPDGQIFSVPGADLIGQAVAGGIAAVEAAEASALAAIGTAQTTGVGAVNTAKDGALAAINPLVTDAETAASNAAADAAIALAASNAVQVSGAGDKSWVIKIEREDGTTSVPAFQWQPRIDADRVWLNGEVSTIGAVSTQPTSGQSAFGGRLMSTMPGGLSGGYTRAVRFRRTNTSNPSGTIISMATSTTTLANSSHIAAKTPVNTAMTIGSTIKALATNPSTERAISRFGMEWVIESVPSSGDVLRLVSGGEVLNLGAVGTYVAPTQMALGAQLAVSSSPLTNAELQDVVVFSGAFTADEMDQLGAYLELDWGKDKSPVPAWLPPDDVLADDGTPLNEVIGTAYMFKKGLVAPTQMWAWEKRRGCTGQLKSLNDIMIDPAGGNYVLKRGPDLKAAHGISTLVDGNLPNLFQASQAPSVAPTPGTILFGSRVADAGGFGERHVINTVLTGSTAPAGIQDFNIFASSTGVSASRAFTKPLGGVASTSPNMSTSMGNSRGNRVHRLIATQINGSAIKTIWNANMISAIGATVTNYQTQDYWRMHSGYSNNQPVSEHWTTVRVIIFDRALTDTEMDRLAGWNIYGAPKILFNHDSGGNFGQLEEAFHVAKRDQGFIDYIPSTSGGLGGRGLNWHRDFLRELTIWKPQFKKYLLYGWEMGLDYQGLNLAGVNEGPFDDDQMVSMREEIDSFFDYPMVWIGANPNKAARQLAASPSDTNYQFEMEWVLGITALMKKRYPERFVEITPRIQEWFTTPELMAEGIEKHFWPNQFFPQSGGVVTDSIHILWFPATDRYASAYYMVGQAVGDHLQNSGWLKPVILTA